MQRVEAHQHVLAGINEVDPKLIRGTRDLEQAVLLAGGEHRAFGSDVEAQRSPVRHWRGPHPRSARPLPEGEVMFNRLSAVPHLMRSRSDSDRPSTAPSTASGSSSPMS